LGRDWFVEVGVLPEEVEGRSLMAEQIRVVLDGEEVILTAEGEGGRCEVRMKLEEAERVRDILDWAIDRAIIRAEASEAEEAVKISGVDEEDGV
jgi:hypothetical protein